MRVIDLTTEELDTILRDHESRILAKVSALLNQRTETETVRGNKALAETLGVSLSTVAKMSRAKKYQQAKYQDGRVVIWDISRVRQAMKN